jgi:hypothetical protein
MSFRNPNQVPPVASKCLAGYTDAELILGIDSWMNRAQGRDRVKVPGYAGDLLINDPDLIKDSSELRKLIATEEDPQRFFLLCRFAGYFFNRGGTFIPEMSHMLFRHGSVEPPHIWFYEGGVWDVSKFTHEDIVGTLESLRAPFDENTMAPKGANGPLDLRIKVLVKWLREGWPGCETLGDREPLMADTISPRKQPTTAGVRPAKRLPVKNHGIVPTLPANKTIMWLAIALGAGVLLAFAGRFIIRGKF